MYEIKKIDIMKAHIDMIKIKKLKPSTANKFIIFLSNAFNLAIDLEVKNIYTNPTKKIKLLEENNKIERFLTKEEVKRLIEAANQSRNNHLKFIIHILLLTGARKSEVLKAKWKDFDFTNRIWTIPTSKNGKKRMIPISNRLLNVLKQIPKTSSLYLFESKITSRPYSSIYHAWNYARVKAKLEDVRLHDLRHSFASMLVNSGVSLYEIQKLLGHSNIKMTQRYSHLNNKSLMNAVSYAEELLI
jgi:integrase